jgi:hypothetical protein
MDNLVLQKLSNLECGDENRRFNFAWNAAREARRIDSRSARIQSGEGITALQIQPLPQAAHLECGDENRRFNFAWNAACEARRIDSRSARSQSGEGITALQIAQLLKNQIIHAQQ